METATFEVKATPVGGRVHVNGKDVTPKIGAAEIRIADGQPTTLVLFLNGHGTVEGEGIVEVINPAEADAEVICAFLAGIDPDQLDSDALNGADASMNLTAAMLSTLQRYARGE